jgi:hypothetical protein
MILRRFAIFMAIMLVPCAAIALESVDMHGGLLLLGSPVYAPASPDGEPTGAPSPILNSYSIAFPFVLGDYFRLAPGISFFGTQYRIIPGFAKAVPVPVEWADTVWFLSVLVDLELRLDIPLSTRLGLGFDAGAAFLGRVPIPTPNDGWEEQMPGIVSYFYGEARYLYPTFGASFTWKPAELDRLEVSVRSKAYFPIFHLWDGENSSFFDQFLINLSLGLRIYPRPPEHSSAAE